MYVVLQELLPRQGAVLACATKDLERTIIRPKGAVRLDIPFKDAKRACVRRDPQTCLALSKRRLGPLALGNIEIHTENAVRPDGCIRAEPTFGPVWHAKPQLVVVSLIVLF